MGAVTVPQDHQLDAERAVLGSLLIDSSIVKDVFGKVEVGDFLNSVNRKIFLAARTAFREGEPVDPISIRNRVGEELTGYLVQLMEITPTSANWKIYAEFMRQQTALQRIKDIAEKLMDAARLEDCRTPVAELGQLLGTGRKVDAWNMREMLDDFYASQDPDQPTPEYITYGIREIDDGTYTEPGDVVMLGGYPSDGKTALALMLAYNMAAKRKVGFFSLETDKKKIRDRMVSHVAQIDFNGIKRRTLQEDDWKAVADKQDSFVKRDLTVLRASGLTVTEISSISQAYGFDVIFIDYVQLIVPEIDRRAPRSEQMADVSRALHVFAQTTGTAVVELAQLSRPEKSGGWREPVMQDLKESGQFEQDADIIFLLFRPSPNSDLDQDKHRILKVAKNKEGRRGKWPLHFAGEKQTFSVMVDGEASKKTMRSLTAAGKAARNKNHIEAQGQQAMSGFVDITDQENGDVPF
jgi:replicative DNA helicase